MDHNIRLGSPAMPSAIPLFPRALKPCCSRFLRPHAALHPSRPRTCFVSWVASFLMATRPLCSLVCCATRGKTGRALKRKGPTLKLLREKLKELGLPSSGKKADLLETLRQAVLEAKDELEQLEPETCPPERSPEGTGSGAGSGRVEDTELLGASRIQSSWQAVSLGSDDPDLIRPGDRIFLRAHTGCYIDVAEEMALARWDDTGDWQQLVIEKSPLVVEDTDPSLFHPGDLMFLKAHTGCYLDVQDEGSPVQARWQDLGVWQGLELAKKDSDPLRVGDIVFLKSHTGMYIDVHNHQVQARWADEGDWQALTISRS